MAEEKTTTKRSKPKFLRVDWHKKIRLGKGVKKNQKWHGAKGRQNKLRLGTAGHTRRPKVGWSSEAKVRGFIGGVEAVRVENVKMLEGLKNVGIVIGKVGVKKRAEIVKKAGEMKLPILNRFKKVAEGREPKAEVNKGKKE